jgi:hypothetical protein
MPFSLAQSLPAMEPILSAGATAVLGLIAVLLVVALVWTLRALIVAKRNGNGHTEAADEIAKNIAVIEREGIDMPRPWREYVDARIRHHDRNRRAVVMAYVHLLERGHNEQVIRLLRDEADEG